MDADTQPSYESMAAPVVLARRIVEDLLFTQDPNRDRNWNLPANLKPEERDAGSPTRNLLGWAPAITLTTEQRQLLESAGRVADDFKVDNRQFQFNRQLFERVSDFMKVTEQTVKLGASVHESERGNLVQVP